jgi:esterase/lipase superfamily enzyme
MVALRLMNERYIKWYTPWLSHEFEMLVFGNGGGLPLILFPTSFGSYYQNKDFGLVGSLSSYVDAGRVTVYCPDAIDLESFYNKSIHPTDRMRTHNAYENVIVRDVFDLARRECNSHRVAVSGASLGAYHAANIAFRHPDVVGHFISLSGSFDISSFFDGYHDDNIYSTASMNICQTCRTHGNIITWESFSAQANGTIHVTNPIACLRS